jgi:NAD(P)-dependent dehydrogenase (short-subunit alcohol dehydrogenase family)
MATDRENMSGGVQSMLHSVIGPKKHMEDLTGRTAIVTGGAKGIGYEVARAFVLANCRVIMINRKEEEGLESIEKIKQEAGPSSQIEWRPCDLGNLKDVQKVFTDLREKEERLDLVCFKFSDFQFSC